MNSQDQSTTKEIDVQAGRSDGLKTTNVRKVISKDGTQIAFERIGAGPVVILVDGALCSRAFGPMPGLAPFLAVGFSVITYDRRGRNESGDTQPYAIEREVEDIEALIQEAGGSAFVYGISSGGVLAMYAAAKLPSIHKLALYEAPAHVGENDPRPPDDYLDQLKQFQAESRRSDMVEHFMTKAVGMPTEAVAPMRASPVWPALEAVAPSLIYDAIIMGDYSVSAELAKLAASITAPALVMSGGASPAWMRQSAQAIADQFPNGQSRVLEGQTHEVAPQAIAPELVEFFSRRY